MEHARSPSQERPNAVLFIERDVSLAEPFSYFLSQEGFRVHHTTSFDAAVEALEEYSFDICLTDMHIHGHNGLEMLATAHEKHPDMPVLLMSGAPNRETARAAAAGGAFAYLAKPLSRAVLIDAVSRAWEAYTAAQGTGA